jgi:chaperone LolA
MTLAMLASQPASAADATLDAGRAQVEKFLQGLEGLQANFEQSLSDRSGKTIEQSRGTLALRRPNRFRWDYREPYQQVIVADGSRIWLYDSDLEQVTVRKLDDTLAGTPAMLLSGEQRLDDNFRVVLVTKERNVQWVRMEPKREDTDFRWVRLGFIGEQLGFMELADKLGQTTLLSFDHLERNPPLDPARFNFTVPPGADVIGDASPAGARAEQSR